MFQYAADASLLRQYSTAIKDESMERFSVAKIADIQDMITNPENGNIAQRLGLAESVISGLIEQMQNREEKGLRDAGYWAGEWIDDKEAYHRGEQVSIVCISVECVSDSTEMQSDMQIRHADPISFIRFGNFGPKIQECKHLFKSHSYSRFFPLRGIGKGPPNYLTT